MSVGFAANSIWALNLCISSTFLLTCSATSFHLIHTTQCISLLFAWFEFSICLGIQMKKCADALTASFNRQCLVEKLTEAGSVCQQTPIVLLLWTKSIRVFGLVVWDAADFSLQRDYISLCRTSGASLACCVILYVDTHRKSRTNEKKSKHMKSWCHRLQPIHKQHKEATFLSYKLFHFVETYVRSDTFKCRYLWKIFHSSLF